MNYRIILILFFLYSCATPTKLPEEVKTQREFSNRGFALLYSEKLKKNKKVNKQLDERSLTILQKNLQAFGLRLPAQFFNMAPYIATMLVLVIISSNKLRIKLSAPASLTLPFYKGR